MADNHETVGSTPTPCTIYSPQGWSVEFFYSYPRIKDQRLLYSTTIKHYPCNTGMVCDSYRNNYVCPRCGIDLDDYSLTKIKQFHTAHKLANLDISLCGS